jgi:hypothetical protein
LAALLLLFSCAGTVALGIGACLMLKEIDRIGLIPTFLIVPEAAMLLLVMVSVHALRVRSISELEEQSKSSTLEKMVMSLSKVRL